MKIRLFFIPLLLLSLSLLTACRKHAQPLLLFNGANLEGWDTWLGIPDSSQDVPGLEKDAEGNYLESFGMNNDPLNIFSVVEEDDQPAIRIDGYVWGALISREEYENYHLHLEYKWGDEKHPPRENLERNSGLCYHSVGEPGVFWTYWMRSFELEIKEQALGDFVRVDEVFATITAERDASLPFPNRRYSPEGDPTKVSANQYMVRASADHENAHGSWNRLDVFLRNDQVSHYINDQLVLVARDLRELHDGEQVPLTRGKIQLQSEGAEIFYRNIWVKPLG